jgi:hypothetical protein
VGFNKKILLIIVISLVAGRGTSVSALSDGNLIPFSTISDKTLLRKISLAIFQNETNCRKENLISWNEGEPFPSLGIGHAIWFPGGIDPGYQEGFPDLVSYIKKKLKRNSTIALPAVLSPTPLGPAPWNTRAEFLISDKTELRNFLALPEIIDLQTEFMLERMKQSLERILKSSRKNKQSYLQLRQQMRRLIQSQDGLLSLIDYVNFKGEGLKATEVSPLGQHPWGLKTVLERMSKTEPTTPVCDKNDLRHFNEDKCANYAFAQAALWALTRMTETWGPEGSESRKVREKWLQGGWSRRIRETYMPGSVERISCEI